jgi:hypothetical protein
MVIASVVFALRRFSRVLWVKIARIQGLSYPLQAPMVTFVLGLIAIFVLVLSATRCGHATQVRTKPPHGLYCPPLFDPVVHPSIGVCSVRTRSR